ncbi:hypothetical protein CTZ27_24955 [Streptomyces griseocarneus]|nr:hypothetical protein CTZ27_24955 [Streptomyces griseocarneus]
MLATAWPTAPHEDAPTGGLAALRLVLFAVDHTQGDEAEAVSLATLLGVLEGHLDIGPIRNDGYD